MEKFPKQENAPASKQEQEKEGVFDIEKSHIKEAYMLLGAHTPLELSNLYSEQDQILMKSHEWDYNNPDLVTNKIKNVLENVDLTTLEEEEKHWAQEILWFWYHHAISCAVARYKDEEAAKVYATKALGYQSENHPNKITQLMAFLVDDQLDKAEEWAKDITNEDEKETATDLIEDYKKEGFGFLK
jgi:hypothetical protein